MSKFDASKADPTKYDAQGNEIMGGAYSDPVEDMFSTDDARAAETGEWGSAGTPASNYNTDQQGQGQNLEASHQQQGQAALSKYAGAATRAGQVSQSEALNANDRATAAAGRQAPTTNFGAANQTAAGTQQTLDALNNFANNQNGPSAAQAQLQSATNQGLNQQLALEASGRGMGGGAAAMSQAQSGMAGISANAANDSAQLRAQEDAAAKQRQLAALNSSLGGGLGLQQQQAGQVEFGANTQLAQQQQNDNAELANSQLALANNQMGINAGLGFGSLGEQTNLQQQQLGETSDLGHQQLGQQALDQQSQYELAQQKMQLEASEANQQADEKSDSGMIGMIGSVVGAGAMMSDEDEKESIKRQKDVAGWIGSSFGDSSFAHGVSGGMNAGADVRQAKLERAEARNDALNRSLGKASLKTVGNAPAFSYNYKNPNQPGAKPGRIVGPMAQDLERGPLGHTVVQDTPQGKMVDTGRLTMVNSSAITEQQRQLDALKRSLGKAA